MKFPVKRNLASLLVGACILAATAVSPLAVQAYDHQTFMHHQQISPEQFAQRLSDTYGLNKEEVLKLQQQGVSCRDLNRAAFLAKAGGKSLSEVLAAKNLDNTWRDAAKSLGITREQIKATRQDMIATQLEKKLHIAKDSSLALLQQGYHAKDIAVANELAKNTDQPIADVLNLKKINNSWHDVATTLGVSDETFKQDMQTLRHAFPHRAHFKGSHPMMQNMM